MFQSSKCVTVSMALLLCVAAALAQSGTPVTNSYDALVSNQVTVNQCSIGEPVALNGTVHFSYSVSTDSSSVNHFTVTAGNNLTGLGQPTGTAYVANGSDDFDSNASYSSADMTLQLTSSWKSPGTGL